MSDAIHAITSINDPAAAPQRINQHWTNTVTKKSWNSVGTSSVNDWVRIQDNTLTSTTTVISMSITNEDFVLADPAAPIKITLPDATTNDIIRTIKNISAFDVTLDGLGAQTIDNNLTETLAGGTMSSVTLFSEGGNWWIT
jgi:hypothetical protein